MSLAIAEEDAPDMREYLLSKRPTQTAAQDKPRVVAMKEGRTDFGGQDDDDEVAAKEAVENNKSGGMAAVTRNIDDEDDELARLRLERIKQMKKESELKAKGHGEVLEIIEQDFLKEVTGSTLVACHFYHRDFERCKVMDKHLALIAPTMLGIRFLRINAEKAMFFVTKLAVRTLPTVVFFKDGVAVERQIGFEGLAAPANSKGDDFSTEAFRRKIWNSLIAANDDKELE